MAWWQIVVGLVFGALSLLDAWKYVWEYQAIKRLGTSAGHSRRFIDAALASDASRLLYGLAVADWFVVFSGLTALVTMSMMWWAVWAYYPYAKKHNRKHRPSPWEFLVAGIKRERM